MYKKVKVDENYSSNDFSKNCLQRNMWVNCGHRSPSCLFEIMQLLARMKLSEIVDRDHLYSQCYFGMHPCPTNKS